MLSSQRSLTLSLFKIGAPLFISHSILFISSNLSIFYLFSNLSFFAPTLKVSLWRVGIFPVLLAAIYPASSQCLPIVPGLINSFEWINICVKGKRKERWLLTLSDRVLLKANILGVRRTPPGTFRNNLHHGVYQEPPQAALPCQASKSILNQSP